MNILQFQAQQNNICSTSSQRVIKDMKKWKKALGYYYNLKSEQMHN